MSEPDSFKSRWLRGLRSDDFTQGKSYLVAKGDDGKVRHCCLGVAAELFHDEMEIPKKELTSGMVAFGGMISYMPRSMSEILGLSWDDQTMLASMNDDNFTFSQIAEWIEENVSEETPHLEIVRNTEKTTTGD